MADVELLPLPEWTKRDDLGGLVPSEVRAEMQAYARANVAHANAAQAAEIEALRAEADEWKDIARCASEQQDSLFREARALNERAERLAEALREAEKLLKRTPRATRDMYVDASPIGWGVQAGDVLAMIRAALAQEGRNG